MLRRGLCFIVLLFGVLVFTGSRAAAQTIDDQEPKRILGIIPNFRTARFPVPYVPLTTGQKFRLASQDSFDRSTIALGLLFGTEGFISKSNPSFESGGDGFARYAAASYGDFVIGDFMTEAIYPTLLHQDPRYFRSGRGSKLVRLGYAMGQIFRTHDDSGRPTWNYSEVAGNATAVAISNAYYPDSRTAGDAVSKLGIQLGVDMASNVIKEFWPDVARKLRKRP